VQRLHSGPRPPVYALIAEFDSQRAAVYREVAEAQHLKAIVVRDGDSARRVLQTHGAPTLLITDLTLPNSDGFSLISEVRRLSPQDRTAILVFSAFAELREAAANLRASLGLADVADKRLSVESVKRSVERALATVTTRERGSAEVPDPEEVVQKILARAAKTFRVPMVLLSMEFPERGRLIGYVGLNQTPGASPPWNVLHQVHTMREPLVIPDISRQPLFGMTPSVPPLAFRGFAAVPLTTSGGNSIGVLCLLDFEPLSLASEQLDLLMSAAVTIADEMERIYQREIAGPEQGVQLRSEEHWATLERLAMTDPLTGMANRRAGERALEREVARAERSGSPVSLALLDIDHFKAINDVHAHAVGDDVLCEMSRILTATLRAGDYAVRWGGDEFLVLLPDVTLNGALVFAERIRTLFEAIRIPAVSQVTVSVGIVEVNRGESARAALARADARLYEAKAAGRNRVAGAAPVAH
jgi:diguanylate cyclase (GGDEF)-like protein